MKKSAFKVIVLGVVVALVAAFFIFGGQSYLNFETIKSSRTELLSYFENYPVITIAAYMGIYILSTALSLPGAALLTLLGGAIFGLWWGLLFVSFASTIGATLAFLVARFLLRDWVQDRFGNKLQQINARMKKEGAFYLFTLRLIPVFPFFIINLVMALTPIRVLTFFVVSQIGMLPGTFVYVNAGTQLGQLESASGILSFELLLSFALLGIFPLLAKNLILPVARNIATSFNSRKLYRPYTKPKDFQYNMIAIGAGSAGLVTAYIAAAAQAKVALIEKHKMGGDCLNTGCVPSKSLIRTGKFLHDVKNSKALGVRTANVEFDLGEAMERVQSVIQKIEPNDSIERYTSLGVECYVGTAKIISPYEVEVDGKRLTTKNIVIATGARPLMPPIPGLDQVEPLNSDSLWGMKVLPKKLLVLGGGPIGAELAQCFARLGSQVTLLERTDRVMGKEDPEVSTFVEKKFRAEGIQVLTDHEAKSFGGAPGAYYCEALHKGQSVRVEFDKVIVALGRRPNTEGFGLKELGIELTERGTIKVDPYLRTNFPNIFACGDVAGPFQFTHTASHQAWFCAVNAMASPFYGFEADYRVIPWCTYTDPEVARVGLSELEAKEQGIDYEVSVFDMEHSDRALTEQAGEGFVKVLTVPGKDKILGVTIVGLHSGDWIAEYVTAMKYGIGLNKILGTIHIYPTLAEANKSVAGRWKQAHVSERTLKVARAFNNWQRR